MKITELVIATNNRHKKIEIAGVLAGYDLLLPEDKGIKFDCEETGLTFLENALQKARALYDLTGGPVLADDSGLCVKTLEGKPGIFSARFGSELEVPPRSDKERNAYLLSLLPKGKPREAFFVCAMVLLLDEYRFFVAEETVKGMITHSPAGTSGFGYDPIFIIPELGKTVAELSLEEKNSFSHRGRAAQKIRVILESEL